MPRFEFICLANSRKLGGHCVAGLKTDGSGWVRPTGLPQDGVLFPKDYTLEDGTAAAPFDVIEVGTRYHRLVAHQPENWVIDSKAWKLRARPMPRTLIPVLQNAVVIGPELLRGD